MSDTTVPSKLELRCNAADITIEAAQADGDAETTPRFSMVAYTGEPMRIDGWRFPVVVDLEGVVIPSQRRPVRFGQPAVAKGYGR